MTTTIFNDILKRLSFYVPEGSTSEELRRHSLHTIVKSAGYITRKLGKQTDDFSFLFRYKDSGSAIPNVNPDHVALLESVDPVSDMAEVVYRGVGEHGKVRAVVSPGLLRHSAITEVRPEIIRIPKVVIA